MSNLSIGFLKNQISASDTTITLQAGNINSFSLSPFYATIAPKDQLPMFTNSEIVYVDTQNGPDSYKVLRGQRNTYAKSFPAGALFFIGHYYEQSLRVGDIFMTLNSTPGAGRLFMDGGTYNIEEYPLLAEHVRRNPSYGTIINNTGFSLNDMRGRAPFMYDGVLGQLGSKGGTRTQGLVPRNYQQNAWQSQKLGPGSLELAFNAADPKVASGINTFAGGALDSVGNNQPFEIMPPFIVVNFEVVAG